MLCWLGCPKRSLWEQFVFKSVIREVIEMSLSSSHLKDEIPGRCFNIIVVVKRSISHHVGCL